MFHLAFRSARAHWRRFVLTAVAVLVGVSFVVGSFVLTDSLAASINKLLSDATTHTDFVVRMADTNSGRGPGGGGGGAGGGGFGGGRGGSRAAVPADLVATLGKVRGVASADPSVIGAAQLLDKAGKAGAFDISAVSNWPAHPEMSATRLLRGRAPTGPDDVVIDSTTAAGRKVDLGSTVRIGTRRGVVSATIVGIAQVGAGNLGVAGNLIAFTLPRATELVGTAGKVDSISVKIEPTANRDATQASLSAVAGPTVSILSADALLADARQRIQDRLGTFNNLMLGFAGVTLFVSSFLIWNTFSMVIAQRRRELALLRAVGATAKQVSRSVIAEAGLVGLVAAGFGIGAGVMIAIGLRKLLSSFGLALPSTELVVAPRTVIVGLAVGLGVTLISVIGPARRTTRIPPIAAMQSAALPVVARGRRGPIVGTIAMLAGLGLGAEGLLDTSMNTTHRMEYLAGGAALVFVGIVILARFLAGPIIRTIGAPFGRLGGVGSKLARQNAVRDPRRTASTASALMIGLMLVATTIVLGGSVKTAFGGALRSSILADAVVDAGGIVPFDAATSAAVHSTPGVRSAVDVTFARARLASTAADAGTADTAQERNRIGITTGDVRGLATMIDPAFTSGGWPTDDHHIAVSKSFAADQKVKLGDTITLAGDTADRALTVGGIYSRDELLDDSVALPAAVTGLTGAEPVTKLILVSTTGSTSRVVTSLASAAAAVPNSAARTADDYVTNETNSLDIVLAIVDVLLLFAVGVAAMGIANTLALSVVERTRELGLLRAVGMNKRSVRSMVRVEGVLVALFGGVLGLVLGIAFGAATASVLPADEAQLTLPGWRLIALFVAAGVLGVIASAVPARRAARLDILEAIAET